MRLRLPFLLLIKVSLSLLTQFSSTDCYFMTEHRNANHRLFPRWKDIIVISTQTSFLSPCLPSSCALPTNFFLEQSLTASMPIEHFPFPPPPQDHQTAPAEPHPVLWWCTFGPAVHMRLFSLSTIWRTTSICNIILCSYSNTEAVSIHSTNTNKKNKRNCTDEGGERPYVQKWEYPQQYSVTSEPAALKAAACWLQAASCGAGHQAL